MSWRNFWASWQRLETEESYSEKICSTFARGPDTARVKSSDFRRRLAVLLRAFRAVETLLIGINAPASAISLFRVRIRELEGSTEIPLQHQTLLEETIAELRECFPHPTPSSASDLRQGLGGSGTLDSGRPLPPQPPTPRAANRRTGRQRSRSPRAEPASSSTHNPEGEEEVVLVEDVEPTAPKRVLVSLDWHGVLDKSFGDSHTFLDQLRSVPGFEVHICILSYPGTRRGTENKETAAPGVPFYRTNRPEDKPWYLEWLTQEFEAERAIHLDDREDICEWVDEYGPEYKSLLVRSHVRLSSLASRVVRWIQHRAGDSAKQLKRFHCWS